ncbi:chromosome partitioning protein, ParB family, putative (plasmid) [Leptolyngbya sp. NIES-3755]|nr:chromosome partitioning protein, ParB family, putative [Leptolyngbya sp. NIES-3755]
MAGRRDLQAALTSDDQGLAFVFGNKKSSSEQIEAVVAQVPQQTVSITLIHTSFSFAPNRQPYRHFYDQAQITAWAKGEIAKNGIRSALWVRPMPSQPDEFELIAGLRRLKAAKILGLAEVPVRVFELDDAAAYQAMRAENRDREEPTPLEDLDGTLNLLAIRLDTSVPEVISLLYRMDNEARGKVANQIVLGSPKAVIVEEVFADSGISWQSFLSSRLRLLKLPAEILDAIRESKLQYTKALEVAKVKDPEARQQLLDDAILEDTSISDIKVRVKQENRSASEKTTLRSQFDEVYKRVKKSKALEDPKNIKTLQKIMAQLEQLAGQ